MNPFQNNLKTLRLKPTFDRLTTHLCNSQSWTHLVSCRIPSCPHTARTFRTLRAWIRFSWSSVPTTVPLTGRTCDGSKAFREVFSPTNLPNGDEGVIVEKYYSQLDPKCWRTNTSPPPLQPLPRTVS